MLRKSEGMGLVENTLLHESPERKAAAANATKLVWIHAFLVEE